MSVFRLPKQPKVPIEALVQAAHRWAQSNRKLDAAKATLLPAGGKPLSAAETVDLHAKGALGVAEVPPSDLD